jgi:superfamily I DNA/RNA helicase
MKISDEQSIIINEIKRGNNVSINSVAGSGKTTTQFFIAEEFHDLQILTLTYNAMLRHESKIRLKSMKNMTVHTFHSFCCKNYCNGYTNNTISNAINLKDKIEFNYDIIVIDEAQDLTELLYRFILRILDDNKKEPILLIFGDDRQAIYKYMGSNVDYLVNSSKYFKSSRPWVNRELNVSYRLTSNMCGTINHFLNSNKIISGNSSNNNKVEYKICDSFKVYESIKQIIINLINDGINYSDIMIIAPSIKSNNKKKYNHNPDNLPKIVDELNQYGFYLNKIKYLAKECVKCP